MNRAVTFTTLSFLILFGSALQAQAQFSIRAASDESVAGWEPMQFDNKTVWVSPTISLASSDILRAEPGRGPDGRMAVNVVFTEAGARKMHDLSIAQMNKLVAMVLDGTVIFAPRIRSEINKEAMITGNSPSGLSSSVVDRIVASVNQK
jgi:preprotein translocase subunit SecD